MTQFQVGQEVEVRLWQPVWRKATITAQRPTFVYEVQFPDGTYAAFDGGQIRAVIAHNECADGNCE